MDATLGDPAGVPGRRHATAGSSRSTSSPRDPEAFLDRLRALGEVTGELHTALGSDPSDPHFAPEEPSTEALGAAHGDDRRGDRADLRRRCPDDAERSTPIRGRGEEVRERLRLLTHVGAGGQRDPHATATTTSARRSDAERRLGDPRLRGRAGALVPERRRKRSPLRDVAGMLRSFAYAAAGVARSCAASRRPTAGRSVPREAFLEGYLETVDPALLPARRGGDRAAAAVFELEKAVYELRYELDNRPDWVRIPVAGIVRLLEDASAQRDASSSARSARLPRRAPGRRGDGVVVRAYRPGGARRSRVHADDQAIASSSSTDPGGLFEGVLPKATAAARLRARGRLRATARRSRSRDPYRFLPTLGELDLHLAGEGRHERALRAARRARARARRRARHRVRRLGAERARRSRSSATSTRWDGRLHPMRSLGSSRHLGAVRARASAPARATSSRSAAPDGELRLKADPFAFAGRGAAEDRLGRARAAARVARRGVARAPRASASRSTSRSRSTRCTSARGG